MVTSRTCPRLLAMTIPPVYSDVASLRNFTVALSRPPTHLIHDNILASNRPAGNLHGDLIPDIIGINEIAIGPIRNRRRSPP